MRIAILDDYQHVALGFADWDSLGADIETFHEPFADEDAIVRRLAGFDVVVAMRERTPLPARVLRRLTDLRLLVTTGGGNRSIDIPVAGELGITVCHTGYMSHPTAELTWALILAAVRGLPAENRSVRDGGWQTGVGGDLHGRTLGLLGLGRLGSRVAAIGQAFGMETIAWSRNLTQEKAAEHGVRAVGKDELFASADVVSIHLVLSERSRGLVGAAELAAMKPTALLVNTSRGPIVDEYALLAALREHRIGGAALDVFAQEPLPARHPLRGLDNALLTPHVGYVTRDTYEVFYRDAVEDIAAWAAGEPVRVLT
ncbi:D-2-hydroxyacid dehydrogenase family protein [Streptomyces montanisoli]|uniref:D-2-hydroxyacid dehydrogenase family protein n=1 Tax=Streptomyces montanisoli TaxID=2798581 RepID=A0A940M6N4_9ACTN|nr:D-2-hydroxyacid dehydrogenase family protein [Streptomyces montanisoli]MBP0457169.1 D-2-hydroxyacid dehydrogenase family protein [Streptomyces montanisoli]